MHMFNMSTSVCNISAQSWKDLMNALGRVYFTMCTINHYVQGAVVEKRAKFKTLTVRQFVKSWKYLTRGVDFTKYALLTIMDQLQSSENG